MKKELAAIPLAPAADSDGHFDRNLQRRTRLNHAFTGVDIHLEPTLPKARYPAFPKPEDVPVGEATKRTEQLLQMAAAIRIDSLELEGKLHIGVANLATGHQLPAGFAFAREMWIEVATSDDENGKNWKVVVGGGKRGCAPGKEDHCPLGEAEQLNKQEPELKNFQKVLFDELRNEEVVLQNRATVVLTGKSVNDTQRQQFPDRIGPIAPGEIFPVVINAAKNPELRRALLTARWLRVRLLFRSLPPEFLATMADLAQKYSPNDANRLRDMAGGLRIFEMASDICRPQVTCERGTRSRQLDHSTVSVGPPKSAPLSLQQDRNPTILKK
ncbi:MAG: hypothetical protein ACREO1_10690 [Arenimonas sp.]